MSLKQKIGVMVSVALLGAGFYVLAWLLVSFFVSAEAVSHYYPDIFFHRLWGALFVPVYLLIILSVYFWCIKKAKIAVWPALAIGLAAGILLTVFELYTFLTLWVIIVSAFGAFSVVFFVTFFLIFFGGRKFEGMLEYMFNIFLFGVLGLMLGLSVHLSPPSLLIVAVASLFVLIISTMLGGGVAVLFNAFLTFLFWLHGVAFGKEEGV